MPNFGSGLCSFCAPLLSGRFFMRGFRQTIIHGGTDDYAESTPPDTAVR